MLIQENLGILMMLKDIVNVLKDLNILCLTQPVIFYVNRFRMHTQIICLVKGTHLL